MNRTTPFQFMLGNKMKIKFYNILIKKPTAMLILLLLGPFSLVSTALDNSTSTLPPLRTDARGLPFCDNENLSAYVCKPVDKDVPVNNRTFSKKVNEPVDCISPAIAKKCVSIPKSQLPTFESMHAAGSVAIICAAALSSLVLLVVRQGKLTYEFILHLCQEFSLIIIHALIVSHGMKTRRKVACKVVYVLIQYVYNAFFISVLMECLQIFCVATNVISTGSMIRMLDTYVIIFILPLFTVLPLAYYEWSTLVSTASCWINYSRPSQVYTASASLLLIWSPSVVLLEAASMGAYGTLPDTDVYLKFVASINRDGLIFLAPLYLTSWFTHSYALHTGGKTWYIVSMSVNVCLASLLLTSHLFGTEEFKRVWDHARGRLKKKFKRMAARRGESLID